MKECGEVCEGVASGPDEWGRKRHFCWEKRIKQYEIWKKKEKDK